MSKFYIHIDDQQQGTFTTEELKDLKIARETMVWFEGEEDWKKAVEIEELQEIIKSIPPPIVDKEIEDAKKSIDKEKPSRKKKGLTVVVFVVLLIGAIGSYWYIIQQTKQVEMLRQIEVQKIKIQELEDIKADRLAEEQKQKKLLILNSKLSKKIQAFQSFRLINQHSYYVLLFSF